MKPLTSLAMFFLAPALALAQVPAKLGYQGRMLDANGAPVTGPLTIAFAIYPSAAGAGEPLWKEEQVLALTDGFYATFLGAVKPLPANLFDGSERFLEVSVGGSAMSPRQAVASVAYALVAQSVSGGAVSASSLTVANKTVVDSSGKLNAEAIGAGTLSPDRLSRGGLTTDVARGAFVWVDGGDLLGGGPTNEYADRSCWSTKTFPSTLTVDLGASYHVWQVIFESFWRSDTRYIPSYSGAAAYVLDYSNDKSTWTNLPPVAPTQGDVFIHNIASGGPLRYLRLKIVAPATAGNPVNVSMFRALSHIYGDSTRIDARRLYGANGAPAGRVTGTVLLECDAANAATAGCSSWGTGSCAGSTPLCG